MSTIDITVTVNGRAQARAVEPRLLLVEFLRETLGLTGTHVGCDSCQCGACVVHVDGKSVKSCAMLAVQADGRDVTTIEGLAKGDDLHPVQVAFREQHALQIVTLGKTLNRRHITTIRLYRKHGAALHR
ncbi:MAG: 2Fe-2S iron-sulfur cluster-binding protein, partial [Pseudomonadota bacterium]